MEIATFAAGCFWGVESVFEQVPGVVSTRVGYAGGSADNPTYELVCTGRTGHAESVEVTFDPERVTYEQLLDVFWKNHDPTTRNRQGWDFGTQYRSAVFTHSQAQEIAALRAKAVLESERRFRKPIVTEIIPATTFWPAEEYHQKYYSRRGQIAACKL
jgi:peptide-methionine (S)-S-oxide reductase